MNSEDVLHLLQSTRIHMSAWLRVLGRKWTIDMQPIWLLLGASYPRVAWPSLHPWCPLMSQCNLWFWEITGAGRPGRHSQLGRTPPVQWGHSQSQTGALIFYFKMWVFHRFSKVLHPCIRHYFSELCPFKSTRIGEQVCTWGRWTEHPDCCVLRTICSTWLGKHLPSKA